MSGEEESLNIIEVGEPVNSDKPKAGASGDKRASRVTEEETDNTSIYESDLPDLEGSNKFYIVKVKKTYITVITNH
jgi:hypothetical protein